MSKNRNIKKFLGERCQAVRGKRAFINRHEAERHAKQLTRRLQELVSAYFCESCRKYHVGHDSQDVAAAFGGKGGE